LDMLQKTCMYKYALYLCIVFFIVLDLRLTRFRVQRYSFFCPYLKDTNLHFTNRFSKDYPTCNDIDDQSSVYCRAIFIGLTVNMAYIVKET